MAVSIKYIVMRKGKEVMSSVSKKEANEYDKMLDISDEIFNFAEDKLKEILGNEIDDKKIEELSIYLSENREDLVKILRNTKSSK